MTEEDEGLSERKWARDILLKRNASILSHTTEEDEEVVMK